MKAIKKPYKCPLCNYRASRPCHLARHMNFQHKDDNHLVKHQLVELLEKSNSVPDMLRATADFLARGDILDKKLPPEVMKRLREEDAKLQIALRLISIAKLQRAFKMEAHLHKLDKMFEDKIGDKTWQDDQSPDNLQNLSNKLQNAMREELTLIGDMASLTDISIADVIEKLVSTIGPLTTTGAFQFGGVFLSEDPLKREAQRKILKTLTPGALDEFSRRAEQTDGSGKGSDKESAGRD